MAVEDPGAGPPGSTRGTLRRIGDWLFRDRATGRYVVAQWPNLPLWLFLAGTVVSLLLPLTGVMEMALRLGTAAALLWWALWEVLQGVNPFRRILGSGVALWVLLGLIRQLVG